LELLVVVAIIGLLAAIMLPALSLGRAKAWSSQCQSHLRQIGLGLHMYVTDYGVYPAARQATSPRVRWQNTVGGLMGGSVRDASQESDATGQNEIVNPVFTCAATRQSAFQLDAATYPGKRRENYLRTGSYGLNWATFGPFPDDPAVLRPYPVSSVAIERSAATVLAGDAYGDKGRIQLRPHAYTLDGPTRLNGRWGTGEGQTPADPRHTGGRFNAVHADGHVESLTMREAGYDAEVPAGLGGTGDPSRWNGTADPTLAEFGR
jgi:prepilin-type processing-associated H-X9-DG protein